MRATTLVFVHGLFSSRAAWAPFAKLISLDPELAHVGLQYFEYNSKHIRLRPDRRIPTFNDVADRLKTYLQNEVPEDQDVILVSHSQGGIIVQRFLARMLGDGKGAELARIKRIVMFACPNSGSEFLLPLRRALFRSNPQERDLRGIDETIVETHRIVLNGIVNAAGTSPSTCHIPIVAYGAESDNIVPPVTATWLFPITGVVDGDHSSVIRPRSADSSAYKALKKEIQASAEELRRPDVDDQRPKKGDRPGRLSVEPPLGRLDSPMHGRDELISIITKAWSTPNTSATVHVLHGLAGCGKSHVALEIARRAQYTGRRVWWVPVLRLNSGMREVANQLGAPEGVIEQAWSGVGSATDLVWRYLNDSQQPWLLIFDNADEPSKLNPVDGRVADGNGWLRPPTSPAGLVVVTTKDGNAATWGNWSRLHLVSPLRARDGALVLLDRVGGIAGTDEEARALADDLGGLPLALRAAGDYLKSVSTARVWQDEHPIRDFATYRSALRSRFEFPQGVVGADLAELLGPDLAEGVFEFSLDLLTRRGLTQAGHFLRALACLNMAPIPYNVVLAPEILARSSLFSELSGRQRLTVLEGLADLAMIELYELKTVSDPKFSHVLSLHPLVHGIMRNHADVRQRLAEYYSLIMDLLLSATGSRIPDEPSAWEAWYLLAPHTLGAVRDYLLSKGVPYERKTTLAALELARLTSRYLLATGLARSAAELLHPIIHGCQSFGFGLNNKEVLSLRHEYARTALEQGRPDLAEELFRDVIATREAVIGPANADTLASRHKLARAIMEQGRWVEAETELRSIVQAEDKVRGPEHSDTMVVRHTLARAILLQGRAEEAAQMLAEILEIRYRKWNSNHPESLFARQSYARCLLELSKFTEAESEILKALASISADQADRPEVLWLRYTLSQALLLQGRIDDAAGELERLLADRQRVLGDSHPETLRTQEALSGLRSSLSPRPPSGVIPKQYEPTEEPIDPLTGV